MKYRKDINTKIGIITIIEEDNKIIEIGMKQAIQKDSIQKDTPLLAKAQKQLTQYFIGKRKVFDLPINPKGTKFMQEVWTALQKIPYGEVKSYQQIAQMIGNPKAARAVGMANHRNPIPILIPCHRVIGSNGKLVGYALGMELKRFLLAWEKENV